MARYVAFLRAINVGGHIVRMEQLAKLFQRAGFDGVETFIASGNVIFETRASKTAAVEKKIETMLEDALGYEVSTFIRTMPELQRVAVHKPMLLSGSHADFATTYVTFAKDAPPAAFVSRLMEHRSEMDDFHVHEREIYWLVKTKSTDSKFSGARLEKLLSGPATARNVNTVQRIVAKYPE